MKCDIKIMGCATREAIVWRLVEQLGLSKEDAVIDYKMERNPLKTSMAAFRLPAAEGITHRVVLQDDIEVCENLRAFCDILANVRPNAVVSFYCPSKKIDDFTDGTIIQTGGAIHGPAVLMPLKYVEDIYEKWQERAPEYRHDDRLYSRYFKQHKIPVYATIPNPVKLLDVGSEMRHNGLFKNLRYDLGDPLQYVWKIMPGSLGRPAEPRDIILT